MADGPLMWARAPWTDQRMMEEIRDDRVWVTREAMLQAAVDELTAERDFLREMLQRALASNQDMRDA